MPAGRVAMLACQSRYVIELWLFLGRGWFFHRFLFCLFSGGFLAGRAICGRFPADFIRREIPYVAWVRGLRWPRVFVSRPLILDGVWIDHYLDGFTSERLLCGPRDEDPLFDGSGLDLASLKIYFFMI